MSLDMTSFASFLKVYYTPQRLENMTYKDNALLAMVSKREDFYGKNMPVPIQYGNPQNRSANISTALNGSSTSSLTDFVLTRNKDYSVAFIDSETIKASKNNKGAFMEATTTEINSAMKSLVRALAVDLYGTGSGSRGQVTTGGTGTSIVLKDTEDVTNFEVGMEIVFSTADGGGSVKSGSVTVTAVDRDSGTLTTDAQSAIAGGSGTANDDYIFAEGDYDSKIKGLSAWIPSSAPTSGDSFFSVDRSVDASRLAGIRYDGSAQPIEEALVDGASRIAREGGTPDHVFMSYAKYADLEKALGSKVQYVDLKVNAEVGFRGIVINGPRGPIKVIPDQNCPSDTAFMLQLDTWKLWSLDKCPHIQDLDGLKMLRQASADGVEIRIAYYAQLACDAPGYSGRITLA
jgi:hypothetical protein